MKVYMTSKSAYYNIGNLKLMIVIVILTCPLRIYFLCFIYEIFHRLCKKSFQGKFILNATIIAKYF
jgi:hypothetical protein